MGELEKKWREWPAGYKLILLAAPLVIVVAVIVLLNLKPQGDYATLYSSLDIRDASAIVKELKRLNVPYALTNGGADILVAQKDVYDTRLALAEKQLPFATVGFELFDKVKLGTTETGQRVDYQRALEGELTRTLEEIPSVLKARVHLVIPQESSFLYDEEQQATASVMLVMGDGRTLSENQVQGIIHLVSHAVPNLSDKDVVVSDSRGGYLSSGLDGSVAFGLDNPEKQLEIKKSYEYHLQRKIHDLLEPVYGKGNISASVSVELDFNKVRRESEKVSPVVGDSGLPVKEKESRKSSAEGAEGAGGIPGTASNIPGYLGVGQMETGGQSKTEESDYEVEYDVSREMESIDFAPGSVLRKTATVILSTEEWDDRRRAEVENWVVNAISADPTRGDTVSVSAYVFTGETAAALQGEVAASSRRLVLGAVLKWVAIFAVLLIFFFTVRSIIGMTLGKARPLTADAIERMVRDKLTAARVTLPEGEDMDLPSMDKSKRTRFAKMREQIIKLIDTKPDEVAGLVRSWLLED
jgi:flagellar M-ring protein FliF